MSLRDTIEGARREAEGNVVGRPKREAEAVTAGEDEPRKGFVKSSTAKAKPAREAGSSVRVVSKPKKDAFGNRAESKEEKRERKRREREEQDLRNRAYDILIRTIPGYRKTEKFFWGMLGCGLVCAVISLVCAALFGQNVDTSTWQGTASVVSLVLAYVFIIGSFIYDLTRRRPFRKEAEARVRGLSDKKLVQLLESARSEEKARQAQKDAKKSKKAGDK